MLTEFLHDWVKSEPHICGYGLGTFRNTFFIELSWGDWISISTSGPNPFLLDRGSLAKLIYFFQMRLDSFGYGWVIQRLPNSYTVTVTVNPNIYETSRCFVSRQESLIEALLEVYLEALAYKKKSFLRPVKKRHLMKEINTDYLWGAPIPITNPLLVSVDNLYYSFYVYNDAGGLAVFYDILAGNVYNILDEGDYFDEDY